MKINELEYPLEPVSKRFSWFNIKKGDPLFILDFKRLLY